MIQRFPDWRKRLIISFELGRKKEFRYGSHDCCLAVCNCIQAMTGVDLGKEFRGYTTEEEADDFIRTYGSVIGIADHVAEELEIPETSLGRMKVGDMGVVKGQRSVDALCIMSLDGRNVYSVGQGAGWMVHSKEAVLKAWSI